jgi:HEAT repeat protein
MSNVSWHWVGLVIAMAAPASGAPKKPKPAAPAPKSEVSPIDVKALSGPDVEQAAKAAEALGQLAIPAAHDALLDALALGLAPDVAIPAINALVLHPAPADVATLRRYAHHRHPSVRSAALGALASYLSPEAHDAIADGLRDTVGTVRTAAAAAAGRGRVRAAIDELVTLLARGEDSAARALGALADNQIALLLAEQIGTVPDATIARALGTILLRDDFGPDGAKVEVVRALARIQDPAAITELTDYVNATPKKPERASRTEAATIVQARTGGAK